MPSSGEPDIIDRFEEFYRNYYRNDIGELARNYPNEQRSLYISYDDLYRFDQGLADQYRNQPGQLQEYAEETLRLYDLPVDVSLGQAHVRIHDLDRVTPLSEIRSRHRGQLIAIQGVVKAASPVTSSIQEAAFECQRCGTLTRIPQTENDLQEPHECGGCERQGPFRVNNDQSEFVDAQELLVEQRFLGGETNETPESIVVEVEDDIAGEVNPGEAVQITGQLILDFEQSRADATIPDKYIQGIAVKHSDYLPVEISDEEKRRIVGLSDGADIYEKMVGSLAPVIQGYEIEKLALILQQFSGVTKHLPDETRIRGDVHILLVGDPSVGKSVLLKQAARLSPRSVQTSGTETTKTGLTAAATKGGKGIGESGQWNLNAGTLVLADEGMALIDDLSDLRPEAHRALYNAMEQQYINVSKATVSATLPTRASVLGAASPKYGRFDEYEPIAEQLDIDPGLLSQFDLLFTVVDTFESDRDRDLAEHILATNYAGEVHAHRTENATSNYTDDEVEKITETVEPAIDADFLRKYIAYAKQTCFPVLTEEAKEEIEQFYIDLRSQGADDGAPVPVTARKLEGLVRLSEASARVRLSDRVEAEDAQRVIDIVRSSLEDIGMDPEAGEFDADIVETGRGKTQRDRVRSIKDIIRDVESEYGDGAPVDEVLDKAEAAGIERSKAEHEIEKLRRQGDAYEPSKDHLRLAE